MPLILRSVKGSNLTANEVDGNFTFLSSSIDNITSGSVTVTSASYAGTASLAPLYLPLTGGTITGNIVVNGTGSFNYVVSNYESSSIIYSSGSTKFGDSQDDLHEFTGSVSISGSSLTLNNNAVVMSSQTSSFATTGSNTFKGNQTISGSNSELLLTGGGSYGTINFHSFNASIFDYVGQNHLRLQANSQISNKTNNFVVLDSSDNVKVNITGSSIQLSGSVSALNGFTGSLEGTALTASYVSGANVVGAVASAESASHALVALASNTSATASYVSGTFVVTSVITSATGGLFINSNGDGVSIGTGVSSSQVHIGKPSIPVDIVGVVNISGSLTSENVFLTGSLLGTSSYALQSLTSSYTTNAETLDGLDSSVFVQTGSFNSFTSSYNTASSSFSTRLTNEEATGSNLVSASGSFSTRVTTLESASGSFSTRTTNLESFTSSYSTTGSNTFIGNQTIVGGVSGYAAYITTSVNDGTLGVDSSADVNAIYLLKGGDKKFEFSFDTTNPNGILRLMPYTGSSFFEIGNPSNASNDYVFISEPTYGNVLLGPGLGNGTGNVTGATPSIHKVQINGGMFVSGSISADTISGSILATNGIISGSSQITGSLNLSGDLTVSGSTILGTDSSDTIEISGSLKTKEKVIIGSPTTQFGTALEVTGTLDISNESTYPVSIKNHLAVSGSTYLGTDSSDVIEVSGSFKAKEKVILGGSTTQFGTALEITGSVDIQNESTYPVIVRNNLTVSGSTILGTDTADSVEVSASLKVKDSTTIGSTTTQFGTALIVTGSVDIQNESTYPVSIKNNLNVTGSISASSVTATTGIYGNIYSTNGVVSGSSQVYDLISSLNTYTGSNDTTNTDQNNRLNSIESKTGSFATTGSNTLVGTQYISNTTNATGFATTAALYTDGGMRVTKDAYVSGTIYVNNLTVYGTQSVAYITSSQADFGTNIITVNTATPGIRFGGYSVFDSGSTGTGRTGSLLWDSQEDRWLYTTPSGSPEGYNSAILIAGPKNTGSLGQEAGLTSGKISVAVGDDHIGDSIMNQAGSVVYVTGSLSATSLTATSLTGSLGGSNLVAGSVANDRLANSAITIAGSSTSLGGSISAATIGNAIGAFSGSAQVTGLTNANLSGTAGITNANLANSTITIAGTSTSLGGSISAATIGNAIGAFSSSAQVDHNSTTNYNSNQHVDHTSVSISAGSGLSGGGTIASTRTLTLDTGSAHFLGGTRGSISVSDTTGASGIDLSYNSGTGVLSGTLANSAVTVTAGTGLSGGGSVSLGSSVTLSNAGVTSITAGTGISRDVSTGGVTITNTGVTSITAGTGISVNAGTGGVTVTNTITNNNQLTNGAGYITSAGTAANASSISSATGGSYTWTSTNYFQSNLGSTLGSLSSPPLQAYSTGGNAAFMSFHRGGSYAVNMGLDSDNVIRIGGWSASANRLQLDMSGNLTLSGDVTAYSDERVKENIVTVDNALDKVLALRGVYYNRIDSDDKKRKIGVIAQETLPIIPEVVNEDHDGMLNVAYGNLGGLFIEAFKQQQTLIHSQQSQIDELKELVNQLLNK